MIIQTERLVLRKIDPERDFEPWARAMADENTVRYLGVKPMSRLIIENPILSSPHEEPRSHFRFTAFPSAVDTAAVPLSDDPV